MGKVFKALNKAMSDDGGRAVDVVAESTRKVDLKKQNKPLEEGRINVLKDGLDDLGDVGAWDEKLSTFADSSSAVSESFRYLRTKILYPSSGQPLRRVMITSAVPAEGKSLISATLGISLARGIEQHSLLVDCDLRRSSLARLFAIPNEQGLVDYLQGGIDVGTLIRKTGLNKLSLIPAGHRPLNPAELLDSKGVGQLIEELSSRYDDRFILIDTPPLQVASETAVLARHVDGIILVVRWGEANREQIKQLIDNLDREKIIGVVFNGYESNCLSYTLSGYESYGQYGSNYGY